VIPSLLAGGRKITSVPPSCLGDEVTMIHYGGLGLFAEVPRIGELWPDLSQTRGAVLILSLRILRFQLAWRLAASPGRVVGPPGFRRVCPLSCDRAFGTGAKSIGICDDSHAKSA
jgi:hypothetical protein